MPINIIKLGVSILAGISLALVTGVILHTLSGGNDTVANVGALTAGGLGLWSIRADV